MTGRRSCEEGACAAAEVDRVVEEGASALEPAAVVAPRAALVGTAHVAGGPLPPGDDAAKAAVARVVVAVVVAAGEGAVPAVATNILVAHVAVPAPVGVLVPSAHWQASLPQFLAKFEHESVTR